MLYRNVRTGAVVEVSSEVSGEWEKVEQPSPVSSEPVKKAETKKAPAKKKKVG